MQAIHCFGQKSDYRKIKDNQISVERIEIGKLFLEKMLNQCLKKDYSVPTDFLLDKRFELELKNNFEGFCKRLRLENNVANLKEYKVSYSVKIQENYDPLSMLVFNLEYVSQPNIKFANIWIYNKENMIGHVSFTSKIPFKLIKLVRESTN